MLAVYGCRTLALEPEHERLAGPVNVGVQHSDASALGRPGEREIRGNRRLANPAFAGRDGHDVLDLIDGLQIALHCVSANVGFQFHGERRRDAGGREVLNQGASQLVPIIAHRKSERNARHITVCAGRHVADGLRGGQGFPQVRVHVGFDSRPQRAQDGVVRHVVESSKP